LNPIEKAMSFKRYLEEHHCTQDDLAQRLKIDRSTIANLMRLLELPNPVVEAVRRGTITAGHARALLPLGDEGEQIEFSERIQREELSVRSVEQLVQDRVQRDEPDTIAFPGVAPQPARTKSGQVASLEQELRLALGTKVEIRQSARGRGRIIVHFNSAEEFERLRSVLGTSQGDRRDVA
jgi:ParB family chromosome partitioning protein